jgi:formylglycine-generating enzyme required for sulfatase activity
VASDDQFVVPTDDSLTTDCKPANFATWTPAAGSNENLPIDCVTWQAAYAFCIWDGGFLPSEAEWNCAVAGGDQQRLYPWGSTPPGTASQYAIYDGYYPTGTLSAVGATAANIAPVGTATLGAGLWGQLDLEGNMSEMFLDTASTATTFYARSCNDCAYFTPGAVARVVSTSMFDQGPAFLESGDTPSTDILSADGFGQTVQGGGGAGFRCARTP